MIPGVPPRAPAPPPLPGAPPAAACGGAGLILALLDVVRPLHLHVAGCVPVEAVFADGTRGRAALRRAPGGPVALLVLDGHASPLLAIDIARDVAPVAWRAGRRSAAFARAGLTLLRLAGGAALEEEMDQVDAILRHGRVRADATLGDRCA